MFERICILPTGGPLDVGLLAEAMLFYDKVVVFLDDISMYTLFQSVHPELLLNAAESHPSSLRFLHAGGEGILIFPASTLANTVHIGHTVGFNFTNGNLLYEMDKSSEIMTPGGKVSSEKLVRRLFSNLFGGKENLSEVLQSTMIGLSAPDYNSDVDPIRAIISEITDGPHLGNILKELVSEFASEGINALPSEVVFRCEETEEKQVYRLNTNVDFQVFRNARVNIYDPWSIVIEYCRVSFNLSRWTALASEAVQSPLHSLFARTRIASLLDRRNKSERDIEYFQFVTLDNGRAVREAISQGSRRFEDFLDLYEESSRFKQWVKNQPPDADLVKAYVKEITANRWFTGIPMKSMRWALFTAVGVGVSALDAFVLDKLIGDWRPHQFVRGPLSKFVT